MQKKNSKKPVSELPVMKAHCKTCPFKPDSKGVWQNTELANTVCSRNLFKSQRPSALRSGGISTTNDRYGNRTST